MLHYSLFSKFILKLYINWITWRTECGTTYENISKVRKKEEQKCKNVCLDYYF